MMNGRGMTWWGRARMSLMMGIGVLFVVLFALAIFRDSADEPQASVSPVATPEPKLDAMAAGGVAMIRAAQAMEAGATALETAAANGGDPVLVDVARHWRVDAQTLRDQGVSMFVSTTAESMVHDPSKADELDLESLRANGDVMIIMGEAMVAHGKEMAQEVASLLDAGALSPDVANQLTTAADELVTTGEQLRKNGKEMHDFAERMLHSIGR